MGKGDSKKGSTTDLKTPAEWQEIVGITIVNADGWGGKDPKPFDEPIGYVEWCRRSTKSTCQMKVMIAEIGR